MFVLGVILGIIGLIGMGVNYPVYKKMLASGKQKYAYDIMQLAKEISVFWRTNAFFGWRWRMRQCFAWTRLTIGCCTCWKCFDKNVIKRIDSYEKM